MWANTNSPNGFYYLCRVNNQVKINELMRLKNIQISILFSLILICLSEGCQRSYTYSPEGLRKLTKNESLERNVEGIPPSIDVVFKDINGVTIPRIELDEKFGSGKYFLDEFVDKDNIVQVFVARKITLEDKRWTKRLIKKLRKEGSSIEQVEVDCSNMKATLEEVYNSDKNNRAEGSTYDKQRDDQNQKIVISIIETCGFPTKKEVGENGIKAVFLALQHGSPGVRKKYFPLLEKSCKRGDLEKQYVAMMEDRILRDEGKEQIYGTQLIRVNGGELKLAPLLNPQEVNKRRKKVGLIPIEDYLKQWNLKFDVKYEQD